MTLLNSFLSWMMKKRIHQMELFIKYPAEVQEEWRKKLLLTAEDTEYGRKYDFKSIHNHREYAARVPIQDYDQVKPYVERLRKGEQNLLWPSEIKWFAKSSGTTSDKSKFIPVSIEALEECHFNGGKDMLSIYCNNNPSTQLFSGKGLAMGGSHQIDAFSNDSYYGDLSAILMQNLPFWAQFIRTPDLSIALMDKWEAKIEKMVKATVAEDVTNIAGVPTWTLILAKRALEMTGKNNLLEIWPNLELFIHGAVNFTPYREQFKELIPSASMRYLETYNASEGFFAIQDRNDSDEMLLMLDYGVFYEFIPLEELNREHPKAYTIGEVELDRNYAIVISTNAGLWRYQIGDTVKFVSLSPYRIKITGRTKHFINAFGEEVIIDNAEAAISAACTATNATVKDYTAAPVYFSSASNGAHEWLIEFDKEPGDIYHFTSVLDSTLQSINSDYEAKRYMDMALRMPKVQALPDGTFFNWLKYKGKLGGQHKVPRLSNDRSIVEEIIGMLETTC